MRSSPLAGLFRSFRWALSLIALALLPSVAYGQHDFGINGVGWVHYRDLPDGPALARKRMAALKALGATTDRVELWWSVVAPEKGRFDWTFSDRVMRFYRENHVDPLTLLNYTSAWSDGNAPADDAERERFGRYVYEMVRRYKNTVHAWEVWNEPNIPTFWKPQPNAKEYAALLKVAYREAKRADPHCTVLGGATSLADLNFLEEVVRYGGWPSFDVLSVHPYSMAGSPTYQRLDLILEAVRRFNRMTGKPKPVWITEMGWTAGTREEEEEQARNLVQSYALAKAGGVGRLYWFNLQDFEEKWGLTRGDGSRKVSFAAYRTASRMLSGAQFLGYLKAAPDRRRFYLVFRKGNQPFLVLWREAEPDRGEYLPFPSRPSGIVDAYGRPQPRRWKNGKLLIDRTPILVRGVPPKLLRTVVKIRPRDPRQNLLANPGFTGSGGTPWGWNRGRHEGTGTDATFNVVTRNDERWLELGPSKDGAWDHVPIPVEPGQKYRLTVRVGAEGATGQNFASLYWWNAVGWGYKGQSDTPSFAGATRGSGETRTVEATVPEGAYYLRLNFVSQDNTGKVRFSHPVLVRVK